MNHTKLKELIKLVIEAQLNEAEISAEDNNFSLASLDAQVDKHLKAYAEDAKQSEQEYSDMMTPAEDDDAKDANDESKKAENLDMNAFTQSVIRLTENFLDLMEIDSAVYRRAAKFLKDTHGTPAVNAFKDALSEAGKSIGESEPEREADEYKTTYAVGAGPSGA
jgi:hypothetical protein